MSPSVNTGDFAKFAEFARLFPQIHHVLMYQNHAIYPYQTFAAENVAARTENCEISICNIYPLLLKTNLPDGSIQRATRVGRKPICSTMPDHRSILLTLSSSNLTQDIIKCIPIF